MHVRRHPDWIKVKIPSGVKYFSVRSILNQNNLNTVCDEAKCPNIAECFDRGTATFLIMGDVCTRKCFYCNIHSGIPVKLDIEEPKKIAKAVSRLNLNYAVITSVTRDDLPDFGAEQFYNTVMEIRKINPECNVEVLTPDFNGNIKLFERVLESSPYIFNHNIEVVKELYPCFRPGGSYDNALKILKHARGFLPLIKSGLIIGVGETKKQIIETLHDLRRVGVSILTIGQYLQPAKDLSEVKKYYTPQEFSEFRYEALKMGFLHVFSSPLVRSSYHADDMVRHSR
ncbi:MAG: lipoyl synthase [Planctomycetota bacterium]|jgi:lipoic acid synthetase